MVTVAGPLGWLAIRYGFSRRLDAGVGLPYSVAGVSGDLRWVAWRGERSSLALWAFATVPFDGGRDPGAFFGFNWSGAGPTWIAGPLLSVWGSRAGVHLGNHLVQRVLMGGLWSLLHVTVEARVADSVRVIVQGALLTEMLNERSVGPGIAALVGNGQPRVFPFVLAGVRVHSRRFSVDFGALAPLGRDSPLGGSPVGVWPWTSVSQAF